MSSIKKFVRSAPSKRSKRRSRKTRSAPARYNAFEIKYYREKEISFQATRFLEKEYLENPDFREELAFGDTSIPDDGVSEDGNISVTRLFKIFELLREGGEILELLGIKKIKKTHRNLYDIIAEKLTPEILINFVKNNITKINDVTLSEMDERHRDHYIRMIEDNIPASVQE